MICMRCRRLIKRAARAGMGPTCARIVLGQLLHKRERKVQPDQRQVDWLGEARP